MRIDPIKVFLLEDEIGNICDMSLHLSKRLVKPLEDEHGALFCNSWHELLDLVLKVLGRGRQISLDLDRVQVEQADISDAWQLSLEVLSVELEQIESILQVFD